MNFLTKFWSDAHKRYLTYSGFTTGLFLLQVIHLFWLTTHVVWYKLFGFSIFNPNDFWQFVIIIVDYTEVPALISTSILYILSLRRKFNVKDLIFLILINSQWLHLFWITDEFVEAMFTGAAYASVLPFWLAWVAILIDYLELPVMYDTTKKFIIELIKPPLRAPEKENFKY